jgi:5-methylcytosine-specific restriction endonuclease McrA
MKINPQPKPKTVRLKGKAYTQFRIDLYNFYNGRCVDCDRWVPLYDNGYFDPFICAHVSHIKSRGAGGGDTFDNCTIKCFECHRKEHDGR